MARDLKNLGYDVREIQPYTIIYKRSLPYLTELVADQALLGKETSLVGRSALRIIEPDLVVRTLTHGGLFRHVTGTCFLGIGRSIRELETSAYLISKNIFTPEIAAVRYRKQGICYSIEVISRMVPESIDLLSYLENPSGDGLALIEKAGRLVFDIHRTGVYHADLHVKNMLLDRNRNLWIIDLDNAYCFSRVPALLRDMNISRFLRSLRKWEKKKRIVLPEGWEQAFRDGYAHGT